MSSSSGPKNLIFVVGNPSGKYREFANEIKDNFEDTVYADEPNFGIGVYLPSTARETAIRKSMFFSQVLFYGAMPSRRNIVISTSNISMRYLLQFVILFDDFVKNVYLIIDDRNISAFYGTMFDELKQKFPKENLFVLSKIEDEKPQFSENLAIEISKRIKANMPFVKASTLNMFNDILGKIPEIYRDEFKKMVYGHEFGDIPFDRVKRCLLPEMEQEKDEEMEEEKEKKTKITDYFKVEEPPKILKDEVRQEDEELSPIDSSNWTSLLDFYDDDELNPSQIK